MVWTLRDGTFLIVGNSGQKETVTLEIPQGALPDAVVKVLEQAAAEIRRKAALLQEEWVTTHGQR